MDPPLLVRLSAIEPDDNLFTCFRLSSYKEELNILSLPFPTHDTCTLFSSYFFKERERTGQEGAEGEEIMVKVVILF
ncbi:hypothetical protein Tco_0106597, partial [Tanacetum coccineum]